MRFSSDGSQVAVADCSNGRVSLFQVRPLHTFTGALGMLGMGGHVHSPVIGCWVWVITARQRVGMLGMNNHAGSP